MKDITASKESLVGFASTHFETHHSFHLHMGNMHSFLIIKKNTLRLDEDLASCVHTLHSLASHFVIISSLLAPVCKTPFTALIGLKMAIICNIDSFQFLSIKIVPIPIGFRAHIHIENLVMGAWNRGIKGCNPLTLFLPYFISLGHWICVPYSIFVNYYKL